MAPKYVWDIPTWLRKIPEPNRTRCLKLWSDNRYLFLYARGSSHNHHTWEGGYVSHLQEVFNIATLLYEAMNTTWLLPFSVESAILVLFLHDLEKPWKETEKFKDKEARRLFRELKIAEYGIELTALEANALRYVEGEGDDYSSKGRVMWELAAFCHMCDIASARIRYDFPNVLGEKNTGWRE